MIFPMLCAALVLFGSECWVRVEQEFMVKNKMRNWTDSMIHGYHLSRAFLSTDLMTHRGWSFVFP